MKKSIIATILICVFISFTPRQQPTEFKFTFTTQQVNTIITGLQYSEAVSSSEANKLIAEINKQIQSQIKVDSTQKKKP